MREQFEQSIKNTLSYQKLVFQHGERLFIYEDGQYKIAAVQLAWEICLANQHAHSNPHGHNATCTYQFELAFLHLQDTPELRRMYWSALGQLQFDNNDQVITPELEQCACCKENHVDSI
ncbi:hypothetical protein F909_03900 [Acinetobacter sp. ANC 3929]|uniref:hypothetical protein n=1 Tax=Acinetobacter sp. ANC 3929 TaxID=1217707 RepID=UPI0002D12A72|nr:hypothetical protein [Acinetobacter sp. ANC 3929]ENW78214.1 hypothetical protein F909_03900 [Acinetobacter sp. ANC 3929]